MTAPKNRRWQLRARHAQMSPPFVGAKRKRVCYKDKGSFP